MDRVVLVAHLKPGSRERARELLAEHSSREDIEAAFERHAIFLSETEAVFFFEGPDADRSVRAIFNNPSASEIGHWIPTLRRTVALGAGGVFPRTSGCEEYGMRFRRRADAHRPGRLRPLLRDDDREL
jgi:hypothetical protein